MANKNKKKQPKIILVDPAKCRMWTHHNRNYKALDKQKCSSLMSSIINEGEQKFPAIVRPIADGSEYEYEVICGARRHWVITQLRQHVDERFQYLIDVRQLSDEDAFRISDIENRQRVDISHYERANDYLLALEKYYSSQKEMARQLGVNEAWLSRYLDIARLPLEIINCFQNKNEILPVHAKKLKKAMKDKDVESEVLELAVELARSNNKLSAVEVVKKLTSEYLNGSPVIQVGEPCEPLLVIKKENSLMLRLDLVDGKLRPKDVSDAIEVLNKHL